MLGILFVAMILLWSACSSSPPKHKSSANNTSLAGSAQPDDPTPTSSPSVQIPIITTTAPSTAPTQVPPVLPSAGGSPVTPTCADTDLLLTVVPAAATAQAGTYIRFTLDIKNVSGRPCTRDLGPDHQEAYLQSGTDKVWSSDVCNAAHGSDVVLMAPDIVHSYSSTWNGLASDAGCAPNRAAPKPAKYQLIGRLDTKLSEPVTLQLT